jgi:putative redox protein
MEIAITFPGGKRVDAAFQDSVIRTDQSPQSGGQGTAPEPYMLFLASIGTCAGIYALGFCQSRGLPTAGLGLTQRLEWNEVTHKLERVNLEVSLPAGFPEKYHDALLRAVDQCAVKRAILDPPAFEVRTAPAR